ncbi:MAG TPA: phage portal protein [Thermomicrobiales bacterium]|nr:phage portal protein [Thermomicrobiales bacterium]
MDDYGWLATRDAARRARYRESLEFYEGRQWLGRPLPGERRLTANYARTLVRKVASYLFPEPVTFAVAPEDAGAAARERSRRAEAALAEVYAANDLAAVDFDAAIDAAVLGDGAFKVVWGAAERRPVVTAVDVQALFAWWDADDPRRVTRVVQRGVLPAEEARARYGVAAREAAATVVEDWRPERFTLTVAGEVVRDEANPFGRLPYVIFANAPRPHDFWGESDLADLLDVQRELNRRLSVVARILELSGNPIAVLENVEGAEGIQVGPGALWELPEGAKAYLLDLLAGGGVGLHLQYIDLLYRVLHDLAETPRTAFGDAGRDLSGAALEVEIQPLIQKVKRKRRVWDSVFARRNALILDLLARFGGLDIGDSRRTTAIWGAILPDDREALVRQEIQLVDHALHSRRTALAVLGADDPEHELRLIDEETAEEASAGRTGRRA